MLHFAFESNGSPLVLTLPAIREPPQWLCRRTVELINAKIEKINVSMDIEAVENSVSVSHPDSINKDLDLSSLNSASIVAKGTESVTSEDSLKLINEFMTLSDQKELEGQNLNRIAGNFKSELLENFEAISTIEELEDFSLNVSQSWIAIIKLTQNLLNSPENPAFRTLKLSNSTFYLRMGRYKSALEFLCVCLGFESFNEEFLPVPHENCAILQLDFKNYKPSLWLDRCIAVLKRNSESCSEMFKHKAKIIKEPVFLYSLQ